MSIKKQHKTTIGKFSIITLADWKVIEEKTVLSGGVSNLETIVAKDFSRYYGTRVRWMTRWANPHTECKEVSFPNKLDVSETDVTQFEKDLLKYHLNTIESKLKFRIQDDMNKVVDGRANNFMTDMSFLQFNLFVNYLRKFVTGDYNTIPDTVQDHGDVTRFNEHHLEYSILNGSTIPPLVNVDWCLPLWIDKSTKERKRGRVMYLKFVYSEYTRLLRADLKYIVEVFKPDANDPNKGKWFQC